jgi:hypothetical protein
MNACHQAELRRAEGGDFRRTQRGQAETIAALTEAMREMAGQIADLKAAPATYVEISGDGTLRAAPSGQSARVGNLRRGQVVRLLSTWKRWRHIELVDENLRGTGERGWIYRRMVSKLDAK